MANKLHVVARPAWLFRSSIVLFIMVLVTVTIYLSKESKIVPGNSLWTPIIHVISSFSKPSNISANSLKPDDRNGGISSKPMNVDGNSLKPDDRNGGISLTPMNHIESALSMPNNSENSLNLKSGRNNSGNSLKRDDRKGGIYLEPMNVHGNSLKPDDRNGGISLTPINHTKSALSMPNNSENSLNPKSTGRNNSGNSLKRDDRNGGIYSEPMNVHGNSLKSDDRNSGISLTPMNHIGSALAMPNNSENSLNSKSTGRNNSGNSSKPKSNGKNNSGNSLNSKSTGRNNSGNSSQPKSNGRNNSENSMKLNGTGRNNSGNSLKSKSNGRNNSENSLKPNSTGRNNSGNTSNPKSNGRNNSGNSSKRKSNGRNNSRNSSKRKSTGRNNAGKSWKPKSTGRNNAGKSWKPKSTGRNNPGKSLKPKSTGKSNSGNSLMTMNHNGSSLSMPNNPGNSLKPKSTGRNNSLKQCDFSSGKWVYDNNSYPLYKDHQCPYMAADLACEKFGRKDLKYQNWRWQPKNCDIPRFNAKALLERLKDKRLVFVGDSVNRNQWVSMMCLLESTIPVGLKSRNINGSLYTFKATEYNASIEFYWAPLLVESNADDPSHHRLDNVIVKTNTIEKHARHWTDADILVFNSYHWWKSIPEFKVLSGSFENPEKVDNVVKTRHWYKMVLKTWSDWLDTHVNRAKTKLFFVSMTATHYQALEWGMKRDHNCMNEKEPIMKEGYRGSISDPEMMQIVEEVIRRMKTKGVEIQLVNVAQLTEYRKDGHPSIYRKQWWPLSKEQLSNPMSYADCTHWCLPGVPDVWNEILSAYIMNL